MIIVGAGMAGLLAARMLHRHKPIVIEAQPSLPNNHHAVLRFRSTKVGDVLGIPFRKVSMISDTVKWSNPVADSMAYSFKNSQQYRSDRSVTRGLTTEERYIAPPNLIEQMADGLDIHFDQRFAFDSALPTEPIVSTVPMPVLSKRLAYEGLPPFQYGSGSVIRATIADCDAYVSLLTPNPVSPFSRISITGNELICECPMLQPGNLTDYIEIAKRAAGLCGINPSQVADVDPPVAQTYNKILPIDDDARKQFIWWATDQHKIFSLGRFATWRPGLLLDDLVKDIRLIDQWASRNSRYEVAKHRS